MLTDLFVIQTGLFYGIGIVCLYQLEELPYRYTRQKFTCLLKLAGYMSRGIVQRNISFKITIKQKHRTSPLTEL